MRHLVRSIVSNYVVLGAQMASAVLLAPLFIDHQGIAAFGRWSLIGAIIGYLQLSDLGVGPATARYVAAGGSTGRISTAVNATFGLLVCVGGILLVAAAAVALTAPASGDSRSFHVALAWAMAIFAVRLPLTVAESVLYGSGRIVERNIFLAASAATTFLTVATVLLLGGGLVSVVLGAGIAQLIVSAMLAAYALVAVDDLQISPRLIDRKHLRSIATVTTGIFGLNLATQIVVYSDTLVVGALYGAISTGVYAVAMRAVQGATLLLNQISDAFFPSFAHAHAAGDQHLAPRIAIATRLTVCIAFALIGALIAFGGRLIQIWVGQGFERALVPMLLLSTSLAVNGPASLRGALGHRGEPTWTVGTNSID